MLLTPPGHGPVERYARYIPNEEYDLAPNEDYDPAPSDDEPYIVYKHKGTRDERNEKPAANEERFYETWEVDKNTGEEREVTSQLMSQFSPETHSLSILAGDSSAGTQTQPLTQTDTQTE